MNCVILQPSYIPWRGYFHQIQKADIFVFYDDVQYDSLGWRNRNRVKTTSGPQWITIPVHHKGHLADGITNGAIEICWSHPWSKKHWRTIEQSYSKAPFFKHYADAVHKLFSRRPQRLVDFTIPATIEITRLLGINHTRFCCSSELGAEGQKSDRLVCILKKLGATHYISGPSAQNYLEAHKFAAAGISVEFMKYDYPEYPQLYPPFDPAVSILDLLFMTGTDAGGYIWGRDAN
jgi:WbqC-like protein family